MIVLGIWDGHNSSASVAEDGKITASVSEDRFTRRKLEPLFPENSIKYCLSSLNLRPKDIKEVALSTTDFSLTVTRLFPKIKDDYWYVRRKLRKAPSEDINRRILNITGQLKPNVIFSRLSEFAIKKHLSKLGFDMAKTKIHFLDHHDCHAASAYYTSGHRRATCITLDGLGDGVSSTVNICDQGTIERIATTPTKDSLGLFFQEVTHLAGMRILEDEGKIMALADYSYLTESEPNPMLKLFKVEDTRIKANYSPEKRFSILKNLFWKNSLENFSKMAQLTLENVAEKLFLNSLENTGIKDVVFAGGIASNIKMNMKIRELDDVKSFYIYPDMSDSGISAGAALLLSNRLYGTKPYKLDNMYLGPESSEEEIVSEFKKHRKKITFERIKDASSYAGELISQNSIIFRFCGRAEAGPRALGNRSILAPAANTELKNMLNSSIKKRSWYQPFCPTILEQDVPKFIFGTKQIYNRFMTMGYKLNENMHEHAKAVMNIDNSVRPQVLGDENPDYKRLLLKVKEETGYGIVLNTSFNMHGMPIVNTPHDAVETMIKTGNRYMFLGDYFVKLR